jgi:hypothetical protein
MVIPPKLGPAYYKTYQVVAPLSTHFRRATCEEVGCEKLALGFKVVVDEKTDLGKRQAAYIRGDRTRQAVESKTPVGLTEFVFVAGNNCFAEHQTRLERQELFIVRDGDRRGNPRGTTPRQHKNAAEWQEDFAEHQSKLHDAQERG